MRQLIKENKDVNIYKSEIRKILNISRLSNSALNIEEKNPKLEQNIKMILTCISGYGRTDGHILIVKKPSDKKIQEKYHT